jgi:hypothetical protein
MTTFDIVWEPRPPAHLFRRWASASRGAAEAVSGAAKTAWEIRTTTRSTCVLSDPEGHLAVHAPTGIVAFIESDCGLQGIPTQLRGSTIRFLGEGGRDLGGVRLGQPGGGGAIGVQAIAFEPGGGLVALASVQGRLELGDIAIEGSSRLVLLFLDPPGQRLVPVAR